MHGVTQDSYTRPVEISRLRRHLGHLDVSDDTKLHVVNVTAAPPVHRWRVFVPENALYHFAVVVDGVEKISSAGGTLSTSGLRAGENMVSASLGYETEWGIWFGVDDGSATDCVCMATWKDVSKNHLVQCQNIAGSQTHTIDPQSTEIADGNLLLAEWRVANDSLEHSNAELPNHYVQLWIKKKPSKK